MHGPIPTCVPQRTAYFLLQKIGKVYDIPIHNKVRQIARVRFQLLQQLQTTERHIPMVSGGVDEKSRIGTTVTVLQEVWERLVENSDILQWYLRLGREGLSAGGGGW